MTTNSHSNSHFRAETVIWTVLILSFTQTIHYSPEKSQYLFISIHLTKNLNRIFYRQYSYMSEINNIIWVWCIDGDLYVHCHSHALTQILSHYFRSLCLHNFQRDRSSSYFAQLCKFVLVFWKQKFNVLQMSKLNLNILLKSINSAE